MKPVDLDKLFCSLNQWIRSGTIVEDIWLAFRYPYWDLLHKIGWSHLKTIHCTQKQFRQKYPFLWPVSPWKERLAQGPWPWLILVAPFALLLIIADWGGYYPWTTSGSVPPPFGFLREALADNIVIRDSHTGHTHHADVSDHTSTS